MRRQPIDRTASGYLQVDVAEQKLEKRKFRVGINPRQLNGCGGGPGHGLSFGASPGNRPGRFLGDYRPPDLRGGELRSQRGVFLEHGVVCGQLSLRP